MSRIRSCHLRKSSQAAKDVSSFAEKNGDTTKYMDKVHGWDLVMLVRMDTSQNIESEFGGIGRPKRASRGTVTR